MIRALAGFLVCGGMLWAAAGDPIRGIDIRITKRPKHPADGFVVNTNSDGSGRLRFDIPAAGDYTIVASQSNAPATAVALTLKGFFTSTGTAAAGPLVTGANLNGTFLIAAGSTGPGQEQIFSVDITVSGAVHFAGQFYEDSPVTTNTNHLMFYAVAGGAAPLAQPVWILNNSTGAVSYSASVQTLGSQWTVNLSPASGSVSAASSAGVMVQPVVTGLAAGTYHALLTITGQTPGASGPAPQDARVNNELEDTFAATLVVHAPGASGATDGSIGTDHVMIATYPPSGGALTPATFTVTNQDAFPQTYTFKVDPASGSASAATIVPAQFTLQPGQSQAVQAASATSLGYLITASSGAVAHVWNVALGANAGGSCTPTGLLPVVDQIYSVARAGYPNNVSLWAYDNCGNAYPEFTTSVSIGNGSQQNLLAVVPSTNSRAVSTKGISGSLAVFSSPCCSYIPPGPAGTSLTIAVEAANPLGGNDLIGSVSMPVNYEFDPAAPILTDGGMVSAASFEGVATSPLEIFSLFGEFPGLATISAPVVPLGTSLSGLQVYIDGELAPIYFVSATQVNGVLPADLLPGAHEVWVMYNGILSGGLTIMMGDANPAAFAFGGTTAILVKTADGSIVSAANPAKVGDTLVAYVNGLGQSSPPVTAGSAAPLVLLPALATPVTVTIGGQLQTVLYAGFTPGSVSLAQINFTVTSTPAPDPTTPSGSVASLPMQIMAGADIGPATAFASFVTNSTLSIATISVDANYPDAQFNVNGQLITGGTGLLTFNSGTQVPLNVPPDPQTPGAGVQYAFTGWSQGGNRSQTLTVPPGNTVYTANSQASYLLTINGTATVSVPGSGGYYAAGTTVTVTGSCPGGATPRGLLISQPRLTNANGSIAVTNGSTVTMDGPQTVTVQCPAPAPLAACVAPPSGMIAWYSLDETTSPAHDIAAGGGGANGTWVGNPTPVAGEVAGALSFNGKNQWVQAVNASEGDIGTGDMSADAWIKTTDITNYGNGESIIQKEPTSGTGGYALGTYSGYLYFIGLSSGSTSGGWTDPSWAFTYNSGPTFMADGKWHHVAVTVARSNTSGGTLYVDGVPILVFDPTVDAGSWSNSAPLVIGGNQFPFLFNGAIDEVEIFNRALSGAEVGQIFAAGAFGKCKPAAATVTDTVTTIPANLQVTIDGGPQVTAPQTVSWVPASSHALGAPTPQLNGAGDTQYTLSTVTPWTATVGIITSAGAVASAPATPSTYTANFNTAYKVTLVLNGCAVGNENVTGLAPGNPVFVAANSLVNVIVSAISPNVFQSIVAVPATNATVASSGVTINPLTGPVTITATCVAPVNVTLTVATNPTGLQARIGTTGSYAAAPISQQVPANQTQTISVTTPQFVTATGIGYSFSGWSTGGSTATTTVQPASNFTATANFVVACYALTVNVLPAGSGTVSVNPATGGLSGLPSNCYAPGTVVILTAAGANGNVLQSWTGATGTGNTATVTVNGATTVTANFAQPPNVVFSLTSRAGGNLSMDVSNTGATTATNVKIISITNITPSTIVYDPAFFTLPVLVPGGASVPTGAHGGFNLLFVVNGSTSFTTSFSFVITASADNEAQFTQTIIVP